MRMDAESEVRKSDFGFPPQIIEMAGRNATRGSRLEIGSRPGARRKSKMNNDPSVAGSSFNSLDLLRLMHCLLILISLELEQRLSEVVDAERVLWPFCSRRIERKMSNSPYGQNLNGLQELQPEALLHSYHLGQHAVFL